MASRCISTLNDLDKISHGIYHKYSKVSDESWTFSHVQKRERVKQFIDIH